MNKLILILASIAICIASYSQKNHSTRETQLFSNINEYRNSLNIESIEYDSVAYLVAKNQSNYQAHLDSLTADQNFGGSRCKFFGNSTQTIV